MKPLHCVSAILVGIAPALAIWPAPTSISTGNQTLWIDRAHIKVTHNGRSLPLVDDAYEPPAQGFSSSDIVRGGVQRALEAVLDKSFIPWKLYPRNAVRQTEPAANGSAYGTVYISKLEITQTGTDNSSTWKPVGGSVDESYSLSVSANGTAQISAVSSIGVLRALETFSQLFYKHSKGGVYTQMAPVSIKDAPKFPHRGILLDVARNYYPVRNILRTLDAMSWNKLNRLHIHATDSQAWPLEIPALPEVSKKGAYAPEAVYTPKDVELIQSYGLNRGVEVIFEIDMPGHIGIVAESHPDLITAWLEEPWTTYCAEPPCGQFRLNETKVDDFLDKLMDDLLPRLSPFSAYFHTGGDEFNFQEYLLDPTVGTNDTTVLVPLLQKFTDKNLARVRKAGLTPFVWEEIPKDNNVTIGDDVVVQSWLGAGSIQWLTSRGHQVIDSNYNFWYLDCGRGQFLNFENGDPFNTYYPFNDWCGPTKSWQLIYAHDPVANLSAKEAKLVLGGEVAVWSELIDETNMDSLIWPRASAAGEVLWSGRTDSSGGNRSAVEAAPRLADLRERMVARGVGSSPVQMTFCTQGGSGQTCQWPLNA